IADFVRKKLPARFAYPIVRWKNVLLNVFMFQLSRRAPKGMKSMMLKGGETVIVDGEKVDLSKTIGYKGAMFSGLPNLAATFGYTNASWTLKADLAAEYVCRLLNYMDENGYRAATPRAPDPSEPTEAFIGLTSGYVTRSVESLPKQGSRMPWRL